MAGGCLFSVQEVFVVDSWRPAAIDISKEIDFWDSVEHNNGRWAASCTEIEVE
jgi:hypothetical protein